MRHTARSGLIRSLAIALALVGAMLFGTPRSAEAAPALVSTQVAGPADALTEVRYGHGHGHHHRGHGYGRHHRGHHFRHHHHRHHHFGRHFGHRHGHHYGHRRYGY